MHLLAFTLITWLGFHPAEALIECGPVPRSDILGRSIQEIYNKSERKIIPSYLILATIDFQLMRDGCEAYLANIVDTLKVSPGVMDVPAVREFSDVFLDELLGLPPRREVDFKIDTIPGAVPISILPYRMIPLKLKELKKQLEELLEKGFIRPNIPP